MSSRILIVTALRGVADTAAELERPLFAKVETAESCKAGIAMLRCYSYDALVVDAAIVERNSEDADLLWKQSGLAVPLEFNFAIGSAGRLAREIRAALNRRSREQALATLAAASALECGLRSTITGLLLQSQLALDEPGLSPQLAGRLKTIVGLIDELRRQLSRSAGQRKTELAHPGP